MFTPARHSEHLVRQADKVRHASLMLDEVGAWLASWDGYYKKEHCVERKFGTSEELAAQDRLGELAARCESLKSLVNGLAADVESVRKGLGSEDWVVVAGQRVLQDAKEAA